jgi:hypothetical protein
MDRGQLRRLSMLLGQDDQRRNVDADLLGLVFIGK